MNETYQHPGKWHEYHIKPIPIRTDGTHYLMSYVVRNLEHNAVYEAIVQAKNKYGWNEVHKFHQSKSKLFISLKLFFSDKRHSSVLHSKP